MKTKDWCKTYWYKWGTAAFWPWCLLLDTCGFWWKEPQRGHVFSHPCQHTGLGEEMLLWSVQREDSIAMWPLRQGQAGSLVMSPKTEQCWLTLSSPDWTTVIKEHSMSPATVTEGDFCDFPVVGREDTDSPSSLCALCSRLASNFSTWDHDGNSVEM